MKSLFVNWKTSLAGIASVLTAGGHLLGALSHGDTSTIPTDLPLVIAGLGVLFAKDGNVTGGTTQQ